VTAGGELGGGLVEAPLPGVRRPVSPFRSIGEIVLATMFIRFAGVGVSILLRRFLGPSGTAVWNSFDIAISYLSALSLGITFSAERLIPYYASGGEEQARKTVMNLVHTWTIIECGIVGALCLGYATVFGHLHEPDVRFGLWWLPVLFIGSRMLAVYLMVLRSTKRFRKYSAANVLGAALDWTLVLWAFYGGLRGVFIGAGLSAIVKVGMFKMATRGSDLEMRWSPKLAELRSHAGYGIRYSGFKASFTLTERFDSVVVGFMFGAAALGKYFLGYQFAKFLLEIPIALSYVAFPSVMEKYAGPESKRQYSAELMRFIRWDLYLLVPAVLPLGFFGSEVVIRHALPAFAGGIPAAKVLIGTTALLAVRHLYYHVLVAHDRIGTLTRATIAEIPIFCGLLAALLPLIDEPLVAAAAANFGGYIAHIIFLILAVRPLVDRGEGILHFWAGDVVVCILWPALLFGIDFLVPALGASVVMSAARALICSAVFYVVVAPLCGAVLGPERRSIVNRIRAVIDSRTKT
jgi:O-antigen/teichoic acid export membrane protein